MINHRMKFQWILSGQAAIQDKRDEEVKRDEEAKWVFQVTLVCLVCQETPDPPDHSLTSNPSWNKSSSLKEVKKDLLLIHFLICKLKLDLLDPEEVQVCKVHLDLKAFKAPWESQVIQDPLDHLDRQEQEVSQV